MPSSRFPIPQGTLDMLILQILSLEPAHGYGIAQRLEQISKSVVLVNQGSLYPAFHRLEQRGWLKADWKQSETGREAKFYSLTRAGQKQLRSEKEDSWAAVNCSRVARTDFHSHSRGLALMAFDLTQLITPAVVTAGFGGMAKLLTDLLNHKSTSNFEAQTKEIVAAVKEGNSELKGVISGGNDALVSAIKGLKP